MIILNYNKQIKAISFSLAAFLLLNAAVEALHFKYIPHGIDPVTGDVVDILVVDKNVEKEKQTPNKESFDYSQTPGLKDETGSYISSECVVCPVMILLTQVFKKKKLCSCISYQSLLQPSIAIEDKFIYSSPFAIYNLAPKASPPNFA